MEERYEVEVKCPVLRTTDRSEAERAVRSVRDRVLTSGAVPAGMRRQSDIYLGHPCRDFSRTDESVRIRTEEKGSKVRIKLTYKGPKVSVRSKAREEREITLADGTDLSEVRAMFSSMGFTEVIGIEKVREVYEIGGAELSIDTVEGLGVFVEAEKVSTSVPDAESEVNALMDSLGLRDRERRSYLEMVLER